MKRLILASLLLAAAPAAADEHLVPEDNQFTRAALPGGRGSLAPYYEKVLALLPDAYTLDVRARVIVMPSYGPEYAVGIREKDGAYSVFQLALSAQVWRYEMLQSVRAIDQTGLDARMLQGLNDAIKELELSLPKDFHNIEVDRCEMPLPTATAQPVLDVWQKMLLRTRFSEAREVGRDGTDYHFSARGQTQQLSGKAWEPPPNSEAGRLVALVETIRKACTLKNAALLEELKPQAEALQARLGG